MVRTLERKSKQNILCVQTPKSTYVLTSCVFCRLRLFLLLCVFMCTTVRVSQCHCGKER